MTPQGCLQGSQTTCHQPIYYLYIILLRGNVLSMGSWSVVIHPLVKDWLHELRNEDRQTLALISKALDVVIEGAGPSTGRPLVDTLTGSKLPNLKELRPPSTGRTEIRLLMVFDRARNLVILVGGDKSGAWSKWYKKAIPLAEQRFEQYEKGEWS